MKILHIVPSYLPATRYGGPIQSVHNLNKELVRQGVAVTVLTTNVDGSVDSAAPLGRPVMLDGVEVFYFPIIFRPWEYSCQLHRALAANVKNFDLIHITSVFLSASTLGAYYAKKFNKPYIISPRGNFMEEALKFNSFKKKIYINLIEKRNLTGAAAIHFTVEKEKEDYLKLGLPLKKAIIIPNCIDFGDDNNKSRINFKEKFNIPKNKKIILFMGRLHPIKGLDTLIPAFAEVLKRESEAILILAGPDENNYKKEIENMASAAGVKNKIIFTGLIDGESKSSAYSASDVFVLPSYSESFGMAAVEAMATGLPVVVTNTVGVAPDIKEAVAGLVVNRNAGELASAILKILNNKDLAGQMGERGRQLVSEKFAPAKIAEKWLKAYNELISV